MQEENMNRSLICAACAAALLSFATPNAEAAAASEAQHFLGHTYQRFDGSMSWDEAKNYCESLGGHLATIGSTTEQDFIRALIADGQRHVYWLGGERDSENNWHWLTESPFAYTNWSENQSVRQESQDDKLIMHRVSPTKETITPGTWNAIPAKGDAKELFYGRGHIGFVCEWDK